MTAGINSANITRLGNYMAATFATTSDGTGGIPALLQTVAAPH